MDVREKLVELIDYARYWGSNTSEEIAEKLIANGVTVQEWISVKEPPKGISIHAPHTGRDLHWLSHSMQDDEAN